MKSTKQQYIDLVEGKMSQANFMRNIRMTFPQYVTNVTSFDDSVKILKNKGIINESFDPAQDAENAKYKSPMDRMYNSDDYVKAQKDEKGSDDDAEFDAILKQLEDEMGGEEAVAAQYDVNEDSLFENQLPKAVDENIEEVSTGITIEHECYPDWTYAEVEKLVKKNIKKNANYYTNYKLTGIRDYHLETMDKTNTPEVMAMKPVKDGNLVDTKRGMTKVKIEKKKIKENLEEVNPQVPAVNTPDEKNLQKLLPTYSTLINALKRENTISELDGLFEIFLNATTLKDISKSAMVGALRSVLDRTQGSTFTSKLAKPIGTGTSVVPNTASSKVSSGIFGGPNTGGPARGIKEADQPQDDKVEAELSSALSQNPTLKRILQKVDLPNEVNGTIKALLDRTNLKNIPDSIILAALRKVLNDTPGPSFTAQYATNKNIGKPLPDLKEKLTALVREMLAEKEEAPSKKTAASEITSKMCAFIEDYNEGEKTYKKSQLEDVFGSYEDKVGHRFDDSVFEDVIDMLKVKGYTMAMKEMFDGRDNLDAENEVN